MKKIILKSKNLGVCTIENVKLEYNYNEKEIEHIEFTFNQNNFILLMNSYKKDIYHKEEIGECKYCKRNGEIFHTWCPELTKKGELLFKILIEHPSIRLRLLKYLYFDKNKK